MRSNLLSFSKGLSTRIVSFVTTTVIIVAAVVFPVSTSVSALSDEPDIYLEISNTLTAQNTFSWTEYDHSYMRIWKGHI
jgi:hypothetical protein